MVQASLIVVLLLICVAGLVSLAPGRMDAAQASDLRGARPVVVWTARIGGLNVALNALSLTWFFLVVPSIVAVLLFWLMPYSLVLGAIDVAVYVRERRAAVRSSAPPRRWAVVLVLALSLVLFALVVLSIVLFHNAQLGNLDPGGL